MVYKIPINAVKFRFRHQMQSDRIGFLGMFQPKGNKMVLSLLRPNIFNQSSNKI